MTVKVAVVAPVAAGVTADPVWMAAFARHLEDCGFESIVAVEHTVLMTRYDSVYPYDASGRVELAADCPVPDPLDLLAFLAGQTSTLGLATGVLVLPNHHPVVLAKRAATVDALSGGRLRLCVGVGWLREEVQACGADFDSRGRRADEQIAVLRALWAGDADGVSHHGEFFDFDDAMSYPKPVGRVPIHIGGHSRAAARRAGRIGDGLQPLGVAGEGLSELVSVMRTTAEEAGRDPDVARTVAGSPGDQDRRRAGRTARRRRRRPAGAGDAPGHRHRRGQGPAVRVRSATGAAPVNTADRLELSALVHRYAAGVDDRDIDAVVELLSPEAELVLPNPPDVLTPVHAHRGADAIRAALEAVTTVGRTHHSIDSEIYRDQRKTMWPMAVSAGRHITGAGSTTRSPTWCGICATTTTTAAPSPAGCSPGGP